MARQMLSLLAGDAIDMFLVSKLRSLTSEHSIARAILSVHTALWPGGVWFAWSNQQQQQRQAQQQQQGDTDVKATVREAPPPPEPWVPTWLPPPAMQADRFLEPAALPDDGEEMRRKALEVMLGKCPAAVTALLGQRNYCKSMNELHSMLQSSTFTLQIGYGILEASLLAHFPELGEWLDDLRGG